TGAPMFLHDSRRRTAHLGSVLATTVVAFVVVVAGGPASAAARDLTPQRYIREVCTALETWANKSGSVDSDVTAAGKSLAAGTLSARRADARVVALYAKASGLTEQLIAKTKAIGTPRIANGGQLAAAYVHTLSDIRDAYKAAGRSAAHLATSTADGLTQ